MHVHLIHGDCLVELKKLPDNSVDSIVTDPPYGLSFMGKKWDYDVPKVEVWQECLRVLKPGGHLLSFAGTRTQHRMAVRIEDAGFEIRDMIAWVYGSGFPKSLNISKAIDRAAGELKPEGKGFTVAGYSHAPDKLLHTAPSKGYVPPAPATEAAKQWEGWGTALKPALEPITLARKPLSEKTVAENVLTHGTGGLNIDGCRVEADTKYSDGTFNETTKVGGQVYGWAKSYKFQRSKPNETGRFPANLIHDGSEEVVGLFPHTVSKWGTQKNNPQAKDSMWGIGETNNGNNFTGDQGSAARFFYCAKASKSERNKGCEGLERKNNMRVNAPRKSEEQKHATVHGNNHPTVKPIALMEYMIKLITPPGGTVLDPFMGSGSTGIAAKNLGCSFIGIDMTAEYVEIARARIGSVEDTLFK